MPNGYTARIYEGDENFTLRDYLMGVGRGMGFAIEQRDEDPGKPVRLAAPSNYHLDRLREAEADLARFEAMTLEEAKAEADAAYKEETEKYDERRQRITAMRERYEGMIAEVKAWEVPEILASTKEQAIKWLEESLEFDVGKPGEEMRFYPTPTFHTPEAWINRGREKAKDDIEYHRAEMEKEVARVAERNRYIQAFLDSLPAEVPGV